MLLKGWGGVNQTYIGQNNQLVSIFDIISLVNQEMVFESSSDKSLNLTSVLLVVVFFLEGKPSITTAGLSDYEVAVGVTLCHS